MTDSLKALAEKATPGIWYVVGKQTVRMGRWLICKTNWDNGPENATYIAEANPQTILALIARVEAAERDAAHAIDELRNIANAKRFERPLFRDDGEWADWAQSRARHRLAAIADTPPPAPAASE